LLYSKIGFLKAFSDRPEAFTFGLSPLQTTLVQLKLRDVIIVPRCALLPLPLPSPLMLMTRRTRSFHEDVDNDLQKRKADVIELYQPLTHDMLDIQNAILECMEATLSEIKRSNHYVRPFSPSFPSFSR
jgi:DNA excision repair protein ERCC-4